MEITERKPLSKKLRFEIFKRDGFQCQYCGNVPPAVTLEPDHIDPVANGGTNDIDNLITACFDCNRGKGHRLLSSVPKTVTEKAATLAEREEQLKAYQEIVRQKQARLEEEVDQIYDIYLAYVPNAEITDSARTSIRIFIEKLGMFEVEEAMEMSGDKLKYYRNRIFKYFCGICWNKIRELDSRRQT